MPEEDEEEIEIEYKEDTVDTGNPAYEVTLGGGFMLFVHVKSEDRLYISHVSSKNKGDFSKMMDAIVKELNTNRIKFTMVINDSLMEVLEGFKAKKEFHNNVGEMGTVLVGEWND